MKKWVIKFVVINITSCNDKPDVKPVNYQFLSIYPNPASHKADISVANPVNQAFTLQVFNTKGKIILEEKGNTGQQQYSINLAHEPAGYYQVILKTNNLTTTQTLIKL